MKKFTAVSLILVVFLALFIIIPSLVSAEGTEELGPAEISIASGSGIVAAGTGLDVRSREPESIEIDVPEDATVEQVLLYWSGSVVNATPDNTVAVNDVEVTGAQIGGPAHFDTCRNPCPIHERYSFRADITDLELVSAGANTLMITGMEFNREKNGAGVIVVYDDGSGISNVFVRDGIDLAYINSEEPGKTTVAQTFTFAAQESERTADLVLFVTSVKPNRPNIIRITVAGETTELVNELHSADGPDWDTLNIPVTIPAGATEVTVQLFSESDGTSRLPASMAWIVATLSVPTQFPPVICAEFNQLTPGASVEGLGTVHPLLNISTSGDAIVLAEGQQPSAYLAPNDGGTSNGGVDELGGFSDVARIHDYVFTFAPNTTVSYFTLRLLDFGDYNPRQATQHEVALVAYDAQGNEVNSDILQFESEPEVLPPSMWLTGDAVTANEGEPGKYTFTVEGAGIVRIEMQYSSNSTVNPARPTDPKMAVAILCFEAESDPDIPATCADFARLPPSSSVEGLGTVHPLLNISTSGDAIVLAEGQQPSAYLAPNDNGSANGGIDELGGFSDVARIHDYVFTFAPNTTVSYFSLRLLDFGDYNPRQATQHEVALVAYDAQGNEVNSDILSFEGEPVIKPPSLWLAGDAETAAEGEPGKYTFIIEDSGIVRIEMQYSSNSTVNPTEPTDPKIALALLCFRTEGVTTEN